MKKSFMVFSFVVLTALASFAVGVKDSSAAPDPSIVGTIGFAGSATPVDVDGNPVALNLATGLEFGSAILLPEVTGSFVGFLPFVQAMTFHNFQFTTLPVEPLWEMTNASSGAVASFDLTSVTVTQTVDSIVLVGTGDLMLTDFAKTNGSFEFSTQNGFTFSGGAASVPEPGILSLLGVSLVGLVGVGTTRRFKGAKKE